MSTALKHLQMTDVGGIAVVDFVDSSLMFEAALIQEIGEELESLLLDHGRKRILLDFSRVQYLSSSMLAKLTRLARNIEAVKGQLKITGLGPVLKDAFRIGHLESLFEIYDDRASALKAFRKE